MRLTPRTTEAREGDLPIKRSQQGAGAAQNQGTTEPRRPRRPTAGEREPTTQGMELCPAAALPFSGMSRRNVTSNDVARAAGVSQSAVSRAFRTDAPISAGMRQHIRAVAARLGYTPNAFARGLLTGESGLIGVVVETLANPVQAALLQAVLEALAGSGRRPLLAPADDATSLPAALASLEAYRPDAVLLCAPTLPPELNARLREDGVPVVLVNRYPHPGQRPPGPACVRCDNREGAAEMARHLLQLGRRRIALLIGPPRAPAARDRVEAFRAVLTSERLQPIAEVMASYSYDDGLRAARELFGASGPRPDAVFCTNDLIALAAWDAAREAGVDVPGDVAITGFDGITQTEWAGYGLTTMVQDLPRMAEIAVELMAARIVDPGLEGETVLVPPVLRTRRSTLGTSGRRRD